MGNNEVKKNNIEKNDGIFENTEMDEKARVMHFIYEAQLERMDGFVKKLFILCLILIVLLFGSNAAWIMNNSSNSVHTSQGYMNSTEKIMALKPLQLRETDTDEAENEEPQDDKESGEVIIRYAISLAAAC